MHKFGNLFISNFTLNKNAHERFIAHQHIMYDIAVTCIANWCFNLLSLISSDLYIKSDEWFSFSVTDSNKKIRFSNAVEIIARHRKPFRKWYKFERKGINFNF